MKDTITTGIIGFGLSGRVFHAPFLHTHPGFRIKKIVERNSSISKTIYPYIEKVDDYHQLLEDKEIDLIVIATPNIFHFRMVKDSLEAGKHVIVEKPFVPTTIEARELIRISKLTGKHLFVYHNRRWDGDFKTLQMIVKEGLVGSIKEFEAHFDRFTPIRTRAAWRDDAHPASGVLYDLGPHLIDQALVLFGKPDEVYADIRYQRENTKVDDYFHIELFYPGFKAILKAGVFIKEPGPRYILHGSKGSFVKYGIDPQEAMLKQGLMPTGEDWGKEEPINYGTLNTEINNLQFRGKVSTLPGNYHGFYQNVYDVISEQKMMEVSPEQAETVINIIEHASASFELKIRIPFINH